MGEISWNHNGIRLFGLEGDFSSYYEKAFAADGADAEVGSEIFAVFFSGGEFST